MSKETVRYALWFGLCTGMRRDEVLTPRCERVDLATRAFLVEETKTDVALELPITCNWRLFLSAGGSPAPTCRPVCAFGYFRQQPVPSGMCAPIS